METIYAEMTEEALDQAAIDRAGRILKEGGLVAFPTETVYGLGGDALSPASSMKIYAAKGRPSDNPLIVHICELSALDVIARDIPREARVLAEAFWPGPLTMILKKKEIVPAETTGGLDTVAVRFPSHKVAEALIRAAGGFVAAPSANRSGRPSPTLARYCREDLDGLVDMIIDGGEVGIGLESTIVDLTGLPDGRPVLLRPGRITLQMLEEAVGPVDLDAASLGQETGGHPKAPGMKYRHYAPKGTLTIIEGPRAAVTAYINAQAEASRRAGRRTGVICTDETAPLYRADVVRSAGSRSDEEAVAHSLFRILREFDEEGAEDLYSESFSEESFGEDAHTAGMGQAIMNRLIKAAGHRVVSVR